MTHRTCSACFLLFLLLTPLSTHAQPSRATVTGTVTDADGRPLPGVQVVDPALQRGTTTDTDGRYRIETLPVGDHTLEFRFVGYQTAVRTVTLDAGETRTLDITLKTQVLETEGVIVTGTPRAQSTLTSPQDVDAVGPEALGGGTEHSPRGHVGRARDGRL